jgi:CubicO group peptidase (beta-lactamase class C family)
MPASRPLRLALALLLAGCAPAAPPAPGRPTPPPRATAASLASLPSDFSDSFGASTPEEQAMATRPLLALTEWVRDNGTPILSILVSRNGKLVYELYTSSLEREQAHYLMSVTKTFTSALVGVAIDRHLIPGPDASVAALLPPSLFPSEAARERFAGVTVKLVLGMSALDAPVPPHTRAPGAAERLHAFWGSANRVAFALEQPLLPSPGASYQYTDITPMIAVGLVQYGAGRGAFELAEESLCGPMGFRHHEWMHQDATGHDNGAFGLRLRPIDLQKFGVLYLRRGAWNGRRLLSEEWVARSFSPWIKSRADAPAPNYGWYWWSNRFRGWTAHVANGWKGQRLAVFPEQGLVVTMTGAIEVEDESVVFAKVIEDFVMPSVELAGGRASPPDPALSARLAELAEQVRRGPARLGATPQARMVPSIAPKEQRRRFEARR